MACENCFGLIIIGITSGIIGIYLLWKYVQERNKFSLYMASFFVVDCLGWFLLFYFSLLYADIFKVLFDSTYYLDQIIISALVMAAQLILLLFAFSVFEVQLPIRIISALLIIGIAICSFLFADWLIDVGGIAVMILNIVLFVMNWQKNEDVKSLGFAGGLIIIALAALFNYISLFVAGIFLVMAAALWLITFSGLFEKILGASEE